MKNKVFKKQKPVLIVLERKDNVVMCEVSTTRCVIYKDKQCKYHGNKASGKLIFNNMVKS